MCIKRLYKGTGFLSAIGFLSAFAIVLRDSPSVAGLQSDSVATRSPHLAREAAVEQYQGIGLLDLKGQAFNSPGESQADWKRDANADALFTHRRLAAPYRDAFVACRPGSNRGKETPDDASSNRSPFAIHPDPP